MEQEVLKPCPFCGHKADEHADNCYIRLFAISLSDSLIFGDVSMHAHVSQEELRCAWNTRAELPVAHASISPSIEMLKEHGVVVEHTCHNADQSKARAGTFSVGGRFECSHCGASYGYTELPYPFCPWCGAKVVRA